MSERTVAKSAYRALPFKKLVFSVIKSFVRLPETVWRHLHFTGDFYVAIPGHHSSFLVHHYGYRVENDLFWSGYGNGWEGTSLLLWARLATQSSYIFDIGANTGVYALAASAVNKNAQVTAFEPVNRILKRLQSNVALNSFAVDCIAAGVSDKTGVSEFYEPVGEHSYAASISSLYSEKRNVIKSCLPVFRIDDFVESKSIPRIDLVKLDVENHEVAALQGFGNCIRQFRPTVLLEILTQEDGAQISNIFSQIDGYLFFEVIEEGGVYRVDHLGRSGRNFLICPEEAAVSAGLMDGISHAELRGAAE